MKVQLRSFTDPATWYAVDTDKRTCSCPSFADDGRCKHLEALGQYKPKPTALGPRPSYSLALSAIVKAIRLRDIDQAAYWLAYTWQFNEKLTGSQFRTARRLLIGSAEDGHSVAVMEKVATNFGSLLAKDVEFPRVLAELVRICKVPNWWHPDSGGQDYVRCGMLARRRTMYDQQPYSLKHCLSGLAQAISGHDKVSALFWMMRSDDTGKGAGLALAHRLMDIAKARGHAPAQRLMAIFHRHARVLSDDNNFLGQAAWLLAGGESPVIDQIETVTQGEVRRLLEKVQATEPYPVPGWAADGIHCAGSDVRYTGIFARMYAACRAYNHYGRLDPSDPWLEIEFFSTEGLLIRNEAMEGNP